MPSLPLCYETNNYAPGLAVYFAEPDVELPLLETQLTAAAGAGFSLVALDKGNVDTYRRSGLRSLGDLKSLLDELGLQCLEIAEISIGDDADATLQALPEMLSIARALDAKFIQASVFGNWDSAGATARAMEAQLEGAGIQLALEFMPFSALTTIRDSREFIRANRLVGSRIVVDTWHFFTGSNTWEDLANLPVSEIAYIQFCDHAEICAKNLLFETVNNRLLPGGGCFELENFSRILRHNGYAGAINIEVLSSPMRRWPPSRFAAAEYGAALPYWK